MTEKELDRLKEYKSAYKVILNFWESIPKEAQQGINKELNKVFVINKDEQVEEQWLVKGYKDQLVSLIEAH